MTDVQIDKIRNAQRSVAKDPTDYGLDQFASGAAYSVKSDESTTPSPINTILDVGETLTFDIPADAVYDDICLRLQFGTFTQNNPADTICNTCPIHRVEFYYGGTKTSTRWYEDFIVAHKCSTPWIREFNRSENNFTATATGSQAAFVQTVHLCGLKSYGDSEEMDRDENLYIAPPGYPVQVKVFFRDQFIITDGGMGLADAPICNQAILRMFRREYVDPLAKRSIINAFMKGANLIYDSTLVTAERFTTDATGAFSQLVIRLNGSNYSNIIAYVVRVNLATDTQKVDSKVFAFTGAASGIEKKSQSYRQLRDNIDVDRMFKQAHKRVLSSDLPLQYEDGELVVLSSARSIFEIDQSVPDTFNDDDAQIRFETITGLTAATAYDMSIHLIHQKGIRF